MPEKRSLPLGMGIQRVELGLTYNNTIYEDRLDVNPGGFFHALSRFFLFSDDDFKRLIHKFL